MIECDFNVTMLPITSSNTNGTGSNLITEAQLAIWLIIDSIITIGVMEIIGRTRKPKYLTEKDNKSIQQTKITKDKSKSSKPIPFKKQTTQKKNKNDRDMIKRNQKDISSIKNTNKKLRSPPSLEQPPSDGVSKSEPPVSRILSAHIEEGWSDLNKFPIFFII